MTMMFRKPENLRNLYDFSKKLLKFASWGSGVLF